MSNSSRSIGVFVVFLFFGLGVCGVGILVANDIKSDDSETCSANTRVGDTPPEAQPMSNEVAGCLITKAIDNQAEVTNKATTAFGLILGGVAIMISGIGAGLLANSMGPSSSRGPRPPMPPQPPFGQAQPPAQPYRYPPQEPPKS